MLNTKFNLRVYLPLFCVILIMFCMTNSMLPTVQAQEFLRSPTWIYPRNSCLLFQLAYNRSYGESTEIGKTTDFVEAYECARWCGWVQNCKGILYEYHIDSPHGGCYDANRPCCHIYSYVDPQWGYPQHVIHQDTAIIEWYEPPIPLGIQCDDDKGITDMEPYYGLPYIWYDYMYNSVAPSPQNETTMSLATLKSNVQRSNEAA
jgi:hypothetical protein